MKGHTRDHTAAADEAGRYQPLPQEYDSYTASWLPWHHGYTGELSPAISGYSKTSGLFAGGDAVRRLRALPHPGPRATTTMQTGGQSSPAKTRPWLTIETAQGVADRTEDDFFTAGYSLLGGIGGQRHGTIMPHRRNSSNERQVLSVIRDTKHDASPLHDPAASPQ